MEPENLYRKKGPHRLRMQARIQCNDVHWNCHKCWKMVVGFLESVAEADGLLSNHQIDVTAVTMNPAWRSRL